jgi:peptidyl-prolyl cis-trans isomerase A (cyclophilin A)
MTGPSDSFLSRRAVLAAIAVAAAVACGPFALHAVHAQPTVDSNQVQVGIETDLGTIWIALEPAKAPKAAAWFLDLVAARQFDGTRFVRSGYLAGQGARPRFVEGGMLSSFILGEAGPMPADAAQAGLPLLRDWETTTQSGLRHSRGSVGLARDITGDGAVIPDIVITLETVAELDAGGGVSPGNTGFPVIGYVVSGMDIVDRIVAGARDGKTPVPFLKGQILSQPVAMQRVFRFDAAAKPGP